MISMTGQWQGYYVYGPEYGKKLSADKVTFKISLTEKADGEFEGTCIDANNANSEANTASVRGFTEEDFISFTKEYTLPFSIAADNEIITHSPQKRPEISYHGYYDPVTEHFSGDWEFIARESAHPDGDYVEFAAGTWEMRKV